LQALRSAISFARQSFQLTAERWRGILDNAGASGAALGADRGADTPPQPALVQGRGGGAQGGVLVILPAPRPSPAPAPRTALGAEAGSLKPTRRRYHEPPVKKQLRSRCPAAVTRRLLFQMTLLLFIDRNVVERSSTRVGACDGQRDGLAIAGDYARASLNHFAGLRTAHVNGISVNSR
jgi:hypothetical protein